MPRANLTSCFEKQRALRDSLLSCTQGQVIVAAIRDAADHAGSCMAPEELSKLLNVPASSLVARFAQKQTSPSTRVISEVSALEALRQYLPRALGWRAVADVAREIGEHRNTVESVVRRYGKPGMLLVTPDQKMYVSPQGERLVRTRKEELRVDDSYDRLTDVAKDLRIGGNLALGFFHDRKIELTRDLHGRLWVSPEQKSDLIRWRTVVSAWRESADVRLDGVTYRSIRSLAGEKADLLEPHGTSAHQRRARREETALRYFCRHIRKPRASNKLDQYVSAGVAESFMSTISLHEAAQLALVSKSTIKHWRSKVPELAPAPIPGKKTAGVSLPTFLDIVQTKYDQETKLIQRPLRPACVVALSLQALATRARVPYESLVDMLPTSQPVKQQLLTKKGGIPAHAYRKLCSHVGIEAAWSHARASAYDSLQYVLKVFKPSSPVAAPTLVQGAVEAAAFQRGISPHKIYADAISLFRIPDVWPQHFDDLRSGSRESLFFPLSFLCYLNALSVPKRKVFRHPICTASDQPGKGDILIVPALMDFGIITAVEAGTYRTSINVAMACRGKITTFEVS